MRHRWHPRHLSFRWKILLPAVAFVVLMEVFTLLPILHAIDRDARQRVQQSAHRAVLIVEDAVTQRMSRSENLGGAMFASPIDPAFIAHLAAITGFEVSLGRSTDSGSSSTRLSGLSLNARNGSLPRADPREADELHRMAPPTDGPGELVLLTRLHVGANDWYLSLRNPSSETVRWYHHANWLFAGVLLASILVALAIAIWLAKSVERPLRHLFDATRRLGDGIYDEQIASESRDELGQLAEGFNAMQQAIASREQNIVHQANHDSLTALPNHDLTLSRIRDVLVTGARVSVVSLAIDRFSEIVSSLGHQAGDGLIKQLSELLRSQIMEGQILGHLGGHEFVVALPGADVESAVGWTQTTIERLRFGVRSAGVNISLRGIAGIAVHSGVTADAALLMRHAAIARCEAITLADPIMVYRHGQDERFLKQIRLVGDFPKALENNELELMFQPQIVCSRLRVVGVEALVRWRHPELGLLKPDAFVNAIEQAGSISHLTRWVLREAVAQVGAWHQAGSMLRLSANVSVDDLVDEYLPYYLLDLVNQAGIRPSTLTLEITETAIMRNVHKTLAVLNCIHELGFGIAIDDFGIGQSALARLKRLPVDEIKIDKSFVMSSADPHDKAIVRSTVGLARRLNLSVVAEGVETAEVLDSLIMIGCDKAQGYHIAPPMAPEDFMPWRAEWSARRKTADSRFSAGVVVPLR